MPPRRDIQRGDPLLRNLYRLLINYANSGGGMDGQPKLELFPSVHKDFGELKKPLIPDWPGKNFDKDLFPYI